MSRIFKNFSEAYHEVEREIKHNGIVYQTQTVQDKHVDGDEDFLTKDLRGYTFTVKDPQVQQFIEELGLNEPWIFAEFAERISQGKMNPGTAYTLRDSIWNEFLHDGKFSYTYAERIGDQIKQVIDLLKRIPFSRHGIISIYNPEIDNDRRDGEMRVPCSMYYILGNYLDGGVMKTSMLYNIRSNDFSTHFPYDIVLARMIQEHICSKLGTQPGDFIYQSFSLHVFHKDNKEIF